MPWSCYLAEVLNESMVKIAEAKKVLDLCKVRGHRPIQHHVDILQIHLNLSGRDDKPQEQNCLLMELTLLSLHNQVELEQPPSQIHTRW